MIRFNQFSLARGIKPLFDNTSFTLNPGEKAGLIGANGAGKSTLFAVLLDGLQPDAGEIFYPPNWQIAHVSQETPAVTRSAIDYALDGDAELRAIEARIDAASAAGDGNAEAEAHVALADVDGYTARSRAETLLAGLGFSQTEMVRSVATFSGGWRMRLNLAQALMCRSDLLLLDEPTNHLDLDAIVWLEDWLRRYTGTILVISHDREFLDAITNVTLHLENRQIKRYGGNYSQFEIMRAQHMALQQSAYSKQQKTIAHLQSFVDRFAAKASKARQAQSRVKALERMELIAPIHAASPFTFSFRTPDRAPNPMLVVDDVACGYTAADTAAYAEHGERDDHDAKPREGASAAAVAAPGSLATTILHGVKLSIQNGQRIGLLGANGQGKSTLIKTLFGELTPLTGGVQRGKGLEIGYFAQHQLETLRPDDSPMQHLSRIAPSTREQELRSYLGSFNFSGEMATSPIGAFSGGEKARLVLALIIWKRPNLLLLDEPTNHLDLETREALTTALAQFEGTLILVSHDRHLLRATTDAFLLVGHGKVEPFDGDLEDYKVWLLDAQRTRANAPAAAAPGTAAGAPTAVTGTAVATAPAPTAVTAPEAPAAALAAKTTPHSALVSGTAPGTAPGTASSVGAAQAADNHRAESTDPAQRKEQRRLDALARQQAAAKRKPLENRAATLEAELEALTAKRAACDAVIADPASYEAPRKHALTDALREQGELTARIERIEADWLHTQETLQALQSVN